MNKDFVLSTSQKDVLEKRKMKGTPLKTDKKNNITQSIKSLKSGVGELRFAEEDLLDVTDFKSLVPDMKKEYPYELDEFQKRAVYRMEQNQHVFVIAHTSAGKTATAEYAIALSQSKGMKAIYTSPIKALSNQKYYDFRKMFGKVGIITGDVSIESPDDEVTIMTTEILRTKLYQDAKFMNDVEWVIFDEVHYVNDEERGVVWEEVIMSLPSHTKMLMLSATVENALSFAEWIGRTKQQKVYLIKTLHRPVPLEHFVYIGKKGKANASLIQFKKGEKKFYSDDYLAAYKRVVPRRTNTPNNKDGRRDGFKKNRARKHTKAEFKEFINYLDESDMLPCVFFVFSRKLVMDYSKQLSTISKFHTNSYKINSLFSEMTSSLIEKEKNLPQVLEVHRLLLHGIGVHHAGLLPFLKEIVEVLFSQGDIKVLFATETFAMGVNMPAKTVVFLLFLTAGEYTQMSGRAGRRGNDKFGNVIIFPTDVLPTQKQITEIAFGKPAAMKSQFYVTYWMLINWICYSDLDMETQMAKSFSKVDLFNLAQRAIIAEDSKKYLLTDSTKCITPDCNHEEYKRAVENLERIKSLITSETIRVNNYIKPGRVLSVNDDGKKKLGIILEGRPDGCFVYSFEGNNGRSKFFANCDIFCIYQQEFNGKAGVALSETSIELNDTVRQSLRSRLTAFSQKQTTAPLFQPYPQLKKRPSDFAKTWDLYSESKKTCESMPTFKCKAYHEEMENNKSITELTNLINSILSNYDLQKSSVKNELETRTKVLTKFGFVGDDKLLTLKGKVGKELVSTDGMILTNMLFDGLLNQLEIHELASLLSAFVFEPSNESQQDLIDGFSSETNELINILLKYANDIVDYEDSLKLEYTIQKYLKLNFGLMEGIGLWAMGKPFNEVIDASSTTEGLIVRCVLRIEQVVDELIKASNIVGNEEFKEKCTKLKELLRRDIVNVKSLYLRDVGVAEGRTHVASFKEIVVDGNDEYVGNDGFEQEQLIDDLVSESDENNYEDEREEGINVDEDEEEGVEVEEEEFKPSGTEIEIEIDF
ncbi:DEAD/DEAH box helicase [Entamoeba marina]